MLLKCEHLLLFSQFNSKGFIGMKVLKQCCQSIKIIYNHTVHYILITYIQWILCIYTVCVCLCVCADEWLMFMVRM